MEKAASTRSISPAEEKGMAGFRRSIPVLAVLSLFAELAVAQTGPAVLMCSANTVVTPTLRDEGRTEQVGDIVLLCTGGTPPPLGSVIPQGNITVFFNTAATSRLLPVNGGAAVSEALLTIDEPGSGLSSPVPGFGPQAPQNLCASPLTGCVEFVSEAAGIPVATDNPQGTTATSPGRNVFQGIVSGNSVTFYGVPVLAPVAAARVFRITNLRVDANPLNGGFPPYVQASLSVTPPLFGLANPTPIVAFVSDSLTTDAGPSPSLDQCVSQTLAPAATLTFAEQFGTAFKTRVAAQNNLPYAGQNGTPGAGGFAAQNVPGAIYNAESGFVAPVAPGQTAGLTDFGTRLKARFNNLPAGIRLFVSTANVQNNGLPVAIPAVPGGNVANAGTAGFAQLTSSETGAFSLVTPTGSASSGTVPVAEIAVVNGSATAVWEVVNTSPNSIERMRFAVYASYAVIPGQNPPPPGTSTVNLSYAASPPSFPGDGAAASDTLPAPRFLADALPARNALTVVAGTCTANLSVSLAHAGNFTQGQTGATYTSTVSNAASSGPTSGTVTVTETVPPGLTLVSMAGTGWTCPAGGAACTRNDVLAAGASYPAITVTVNVASNAPPLVTNQVSVSGSGAAATASDPTTILQIASLGIAKTHTGNFTQSQANAAYTVTVSNALGAAGTSGTVTVTETVPPGLTLVSMAGTGWACPALGNTCTRNDVLAGGASYPAITVTVNVAPGAASPQVNNVSVSGGGSASASANDSTNINPPPVALRFVPVTPCRVADTRNPAGSFGGPRIAGGATRDFIIPNSACGVPVTAQTYSLNVAVVPAGPLGFLTLWPSGQGQPLASTLNSLDGRIKSNAAIVPAGAGGAVSVFASNATDVILDINGYFVPATDPTALAFYPITPCRIADTRNAPAPLGGPSLFGGQSRTFPIPSAAGCNVPAGAQAWSLNFAAVPKGPLGFVTAWPTGQGQPLVASLNALTGTVTANAAIVPAGTNGAIDIFASNGTDLIIDINGYFAPPAAGGLSLYNVAPCRVLDTRQTAGAFSGKLDVPVAASACGVPAAAQAHVVSATVVPSGPLGFLTLWPQGQVQPNVATLNALDAAITSNLAIVPTANGTVSSLATNLSHLILDVFGYFAP
jgi:uncharacterized repeat protein (TIGR01451 family)